MKQFVIKISLLIALFIFIVAAIFFIQNSFFSFFQVVLVSKINRLLQIVHSSSYSSEEQVILPKGYEEAKKRIMFTFLS